MPWPQKGLPWGVLPEETGPESPGAEGMTTHCSAQCAQSDWTVNEPHPVQQAHQGPEWMPRPSLHRDWPVLCSCQLFIQTLNR